MSRINKKIVFEEPIIVGGKELSEVTMRVPKAKDLRAVSYIEDPVIRDYTLVSNLCSLNASTEEMDEFGAKELMQMQKELKAFL
ncbi:phage tail assembly protein [Sulfurimonas sp.]|uniref:phage tail assembly protein n=1 Tax=Sulfurimonas sp. TaxID=2022749 RepID=UPI0025E947D9|nr:phage tail assembly protein [Sulfurimonas sp.]